MLTFKPVAQRDLSRLRRYYKDCNYQLCEYSALVKLMWRGHLHPQYAEAAGCLIVKNCIDGKPDRKSTRLNSSHSGQSRMPSSA